MEEIIDSLELTDFLNSLEELLEYEFYIKFKKENGIPLTKNEKIFDDFFISPSLLIKVLLKEDK